MFFFQFVNLCFYSPSHVFGANLAHLRVPLKDVQRISLLNLEPPCVPLFDSSLFSIFFLRRENTLCICQYNEAKPTFTRVGPPKTTERETKKKKKKNSEQEWWQHRSEANRTKTSKEKTRRKRQAWRKNNVKRGRIEERNDQKWKQGGLEQGMAGNWLEGTKQERRMERGKKENTRETKRQC